MNLLENATLLVIDDEPFNLSVLNEILNQQCHHLFLETDSEAGLVLAKAEQPAIILLDILMGKVSGYDVCRRLKSDKKTLFIPVIFLSSLSSGSDKAKGFEAGGVDYITRPFQVEEVIARIENCLRLHQKFKQTNLMTVQQQQKLIAHYQLTHVEVKVLSLYARGFQRNQIGQQLFISENTVKSHLKNLFLKLGIKNRTEAIEKAQKMGLID
jgi:DNA-binding NarL/FixJ family response regulator